MLYYRSYSSRSIQDKVSPNMSIFTHANPILPVSSIPLSMAFYDKLGFQKIWEDIDYGILRRDAIELHLWRCNDPRIAENSTCRILVTEIDELYEVYNLLNVIHPKFPLGPEPWGTRAFAITDPDGNLVKFAERIQQTIHPAITKRLER